MTTPSSPHSNGHHSNGQHSNGQHTGSRPLGAAPRIGALLDRNIVHTAGRSVRHFVITIDAPLDQTAASRPRLPLNLGLVIDASGSMSGRPLEAAKAAALGVVDALQESDHLSLVSFATSAQSHACNLRMDAAGKAAVREAIRPLIHRDSTDLAAGWLLGCEGIAERLAAAQGVERNQCILLSDGHANRGECDPAVLAQHAHQLRVRGVLTSTVGIGIGYSPTQLQAIAEAAGGRMHDAEQPEEIVEIVLAELAETLSTTVENLELCLQLPEGVVAEVYGTTPATATGRQLDLIVGALRSGASRRVVVKLTFPAGSAGARLPIGVAARWKNPGEEGLHTSQALAVEALFGSAADCQAQPRPTDTAQRVAEQWQAHIQHRGLALNQDGAGEAATEFVRQELEHFRSYCHGLPEGDRLINLLERFLHTIHRRYDPVAAKEMLFSSYKLSRSEADLRRRKRSSTEEFLRTEEAKANQGQPPQEPRRP